MTANFRQFINRVGLTLLLATAAAPGAMAQAATPGYIVVEFEVTDAEAWKRYSAKARELSNLGQFVVRGARGIQLSGEKPASITILRFASVEAALAFDRSPAYSALKQDRDQGARWRSYVVAGVAE